MLNASPPTLPLTLAVDDVLVHGHKVKVVGVPSSRIRCSLHLLSRGYRSLYKWFILFLLYLVLKRDEVLGWRSFAQSSFSLQV